MATKRKKRTKKKSEKLGLVRASAVREFIRAQDMRMSADLIDGLNELLEIELLDAAARAAFNRRMTVGAGDL